MFDVTAVVHVLPLRVGPRPVQPVQPVQPVTMQSPLIASKLAGSRGDSAPRLRKTVKEVESPAVVADRLRSADLLRSLPQRALDVRHRSAELFGGIGGLARSRRRPRQLSDAVRCPRPKYVVTPLTLSRLLASQRATGWIAVNRPGVSGDFLA